MYALVVDPVGERIYFAAGNRGVDVINVNGSNRIKLFNDTVYCMAFDLKAG